MKIQSLSIVVPTKKCVNNCKFCVSKMHDNPYASSDRKYWQTQKIMAKRIRYAVSNNVNTCIITGTGEALQNREFLISLKFLLDELNNPFPRLELQTSGVLLDNDNINLLKTMGVDTISLSVSDIFSDENNARIIGIPEKLQFELLGLIKKLKDFGFNIRLSLNMSDVYDDYSPEEIINCCRMLGADQITIRKLYASDRESPERTWVMEHSVDEQRLADLLDYIKKMGKRGYRLPFGAMVYSIKGMSVAVDDDCMAKEDLEEDLKYVILRENGKLYYQWDDEGTLIF